MHLAQLRSGSTSQWIIVFLKVILLLFAVKWNETQTGKSDYLPIAQSIQMEVLCINI